jgi:hypothetical protein
MMAKQTGSPPTTVLPFVIHDSVLYKNIEGGNVNFESQIQSLI